ncbi:ABC transporter substrate-binding protein [Paenibacillus taichungensis]|nr:ABC transporter substrate-binding protein [Paenibacillus taichungensis]MDR9746228.1 ABC transporter substrate-binding protein [Paenibacillus taichungensis]MEC0110042.1 ABC transporter substrate-binding protein [Paenibacillus taichungensis]OME78136.1 ABC transporter substrate-binding protein [Paenibacillus pabuli]
MRTRFKAWMKAPLLIGVVTLAIFGLTGCSGSDNNNASNNTPSENSGSNAGEGSGEVPTLVWWTIGGQVPANFDKAIEKINEYTAEKIGVKIDLRVASWGDWDTKINTIVNSGEAFDIMFTNNGKYSQQVNMGAFTDITDLVPNTVPDLHSYIPELVWDGTKVDGKIYAVPTYKDSSLTQYWVFDDALVQKYNIDLGSIKTLQDLDKPFRDIKAGEGKGFYPLSLTQGEGINGFFNDYDDMTLGFQPIGVKAEDESRTVVSVLEQPDIQEKLKLMHQWYKDGIINPDAPTKIEADPYRPFFSAQAFPGAEVNWQISAGIDKYDMVQILGPIYTTSTIQGSMNAISANSKYKEEALKYLELVNTDSKLRNMLAYGEEGVDFDYVNDNTVERKTDSWPLAAYTQGTFFNMAVTKGAPEDQWDQVRKLNEAATSSSILGFALDISELGTEVANVKAVWNKYNYELITGASDPEQKIPQIVEELKKAGLDKIMEAAQEQINAYFKS